MKLVKKIRRQNSERKRMREKKRKEEKCIHSFK